MNTFAAAWAYRPHTFAKAFPVDLFEFWNWGWNVCVEKGGSCFFVLPDSSVTESTERRVYFFVFPDSSHTESTEAASETMGPFMDFA